MTGIATISLELELGWGYHDLDRPDRFQRLSRDREPETRELEHLLSACEQYDVPVTFVVVGHLMLDACEGIHEGPHEDGWFEGDPGTDRETDPQFYAPDLVAAIRECDVDHEIATHTFSHVLADEVCEETLSWELERVRERHDALGIDPPRSIVLPRHRPAPASVLSSFGIDVERHHESAAPGFNLYRWANHRWHPTRTPVVEEDLVVTTTTHSLSSPLLRNGQQPPSSGLARGPVALRQRVHGWYLRQGLAGAAARDEYVHYWTHLHNIANLDHRAPVKRFLRAAADYRDDGRLSVRTMGELPATLNRA